MKKFFAIFVCLALLTAILPLSLSAAGVPIDASNFPDPVFRQYVQQFDLDKDGTLSEKECTSVKEIGLMPSQYGLASSLEGIKNFSQIEQIWCYCGNLEELDLSGMKKLNMLQCSDNNLKTLNLSGCTSLFSLNCQYNQLTEINLTGCDSFFRMECNNNQLQHLDLTGTGKMAGLFIFNNHIASLNLNANKPEYFSISPQTVTAQKNQKDGKWTVDLGALIGIENISKLVSYSAGTLDTTTGILTFDSEPMMFLYTLQTSVSTFMEVKVNAYKGGMPVITANNLSIMQRDTAFDLKSEPGLNLHASDPEDGDLTGSIQVQVKIISSSTAESGANAVYDTISGVNTKKPDRYTITYTVTDSDGNTAALDIYVYVVMDVSLYSSKSGVPVNSEPQIYSGSWVSSMNNSPVSSEAMSAVSGVPTPPMGTRDSGVTVVILLMMASAAVVFLLGKYRVKAE